MPNSIQSWKTRDVRKELETRLERGRKLLSDCGMKRSWKDCKRLQKRQSSGRNARPVGYRGFRRLKTLDLGLLPVLIAALGSGVREWAFVIPTVIREVILCLWVGVQTIGHLLLIGSRPLGSTPLML